MKPTAFVRLAFSALVCGATLLYAGSTDTSASTKSDVNPGQELRPSAVDINRISAPTMPLAQIKAGMRGVAFTVFEGTVPESMDVEILGVLYNVNGPKSDMILARLHGTKAEYTGVVAGMSGSPVYIDGKLIGALAFRIGAFSKEPICGITPIEDMLEINELDRSMPQESVSASSKNLAAHKTSMIVQDDDGDAGSAALADQKVQGMLDYMKPIDTPLVFSGFNEETVQRFAPQFASAGIVPVMGIGGSQSNKPQPDPIVPGSAVSAILVSGDMNIAATCTVTYMDADRLLACGHPLMQFGMVDMPMTKAEVVATLASPLNAFKIVNTTEQIGAFVQDRHTGIMGRFGKTPEMIPVSVSIHGGPEPKQFHFSVMNNARLTPVAIMSTVYQALQGNNEFGENVSYRMHGSIAVTGHPEVKMNDMFAPGEAQPTAFNAAIMLGERFSRIYDNPYRQPEIKGVDLDFDMIPERRAATLETARTDVTEARPGDEITVEAVLRPYRGERIVRQIPVKIPTSTAKGTLRILVSDGDTLDRIHRVAPTMARRMDIDSMIAVLNRQHNNHSLYVSLLESNPQALVDDKIMPSLPLSMMNVMESLRGTQEMVVTAESAMNESAMPLDYVVSGAQLVTVLVK